MAVLGNFTGQLGTYLSKLGAVVLGWAGGPTLGIDADENTLPLQVVVSSNWPPLPPQPATYQEPFLLPARVIEDEFIPQVALVQTQQPWLSRPDGDDEITSSSTPGLFVDEHYWVAPPQTVTPSFAWTGLFHEEAGTALKRFGLEDEPFQVPATMAQPWLVTVHTADDIAGALAPRVEEVDAPFERLPPPQTWWTSVFTLAQEEILAPHGLDDESIPALPSRAWPFVPPAVAIEEAIPSASFGLEDELAVYPARLPPVWNAFVVYEAEWWFPAIPVSVLKLNLTGDSDRFQLLTGAAAADLTTAIATSTIDLTGEAAVVVPQAGPPPSGGPAPTPGGDSSSTIDLTGGI